MVTKNRGPVPLAKHLEAVHGHGRAPTAPVLGAFGRRSDEEIEVVEETEVVEEEDDKDEHEVVRVHAKTRRCFFTPVRVQVAPWWGALWTWEKCSECAIVEQPGVPLTATWAEPG